MPNLEAYEETVHDYFNEGGWTFLFAGFQCFNRQEPKFIPYAVYRLVILFFLTYFVGMAVTGSIISIGNTTEAVQAIHTGLCALVCLLGLLCRLSDYQVLNQAIQMIRKGVFSYDEEEPDVEHEEIKKKYVSEIRNINKLFTRFIVCAAITNTVMVPVVQLLMVHEDTSDKVMNPYLPQPIYMPFNTRNFLGYVAGFIINACFMFWIVPILVSMDNVYTSCAIQLKAQFEILKYSIGNLEKRAYLKIHKRNVALKDYTNHDMEFQKSLYRCLRANIKHHQSLVQLNSAIQHFVGMIFLIVFCLASFILAAHLILIMEKPGIHMMVNFVVTLFCEMLYTLHYCWYGEELTSKSSEIYYSLYSTSWYNYDLRVKKILLIMICNTRNPVQIRAVGFDITASLNSFGSIITTMYQIMNVLRNWKS